MTAYKYESFSLHIIIKILIVKRIKLLLYFNRQQYFNNKLCIEIVKYWYAVKYCTIIWELNLVQIDYLVVADTTYVIVDIKKSSSWLNTQLWRKFSVDCDFFFPPTCAKKVEKKFNNYIVNLFLYHIKWERQVDISSFKLQLWTFFFLGRLWFFFLPTCAQKLENEFMT